MKYENVMCSYYTLNKKEIKTKNGKNYYKLSLYNYDNDDFKSTFVDKNIYDRCVLNKTHIFKCSLIVYQEGEPNLQIVDIISTK